MAKKENNRKNYQAREVWEQRKRLGRWKQLWSVNGVVVNGEITSGWIHIPPGIREA